MIGSSPYSCSSLNLTARISSHYVPHYLLDQRQFKRKYIWEFFRKLRLFRFVTKQICLFRLFQYRFETPKQTEFFSFWFHETNRKKRETDLVSVQTEIYFCLFRGHPKHNYVALIHKYSRIAAQLCLWCTITHNI